MFPLAPKEPTGCEPIDLGRSGKLAYSQLPHLLWLQTPFVYSPRTGMAHRIAVHAQRSRPQERPVSLCNRKMMMLSVIRVELRLKKLRERYKKRYLPTKYMLPLSFQSK